MVDQVTSNDLPLVEWIPIASEGVHRAPYHLREWCEQIERCLEGGVRALCSVPVRHWKTWTTIYGIAWLLKRKPVRILVLVADHQRANEVGKMIRRTCELCGVGPVRGENLILDWKNEDGGGVCVMSAQQSGLGRDVDVLFVDDPLTEHTWGDATVREAVDHTIALYTARAIRDGKRGSVLLVMSRWSPDDPIGRRMLRKAETWTYIYHPAIDENGRAFAPEVVDAETLTAIRRELAEQDPSERIWWAQYQNQPFVPGLEVFGEPARYIELPAFHGFRDAIGIDMSYSLKGSADYFALVVGRAYGGALFLRHSVRTHADLNAIELELGRAREMFGGLPVYSYVAGPELGAIQYLQSRGHRMMPMPARYNKLVRAQRTRGAWNGGKIQVPADESWEQFVRRIRLFRGAETDADDEVDALVSLYDGIIGSAVGAPTTGGRPRL